VTIANFFDEVETGISDAEAFLAKIAQPLELLFGQGPLAANIASFFASLQQDVAKVKVVVNDVEQALVMTEPVYSQIVAWVGESVKLIKGDPVNATMTRGQIIETAIKDLLGVGIPLILSVVPGGPLVTLAEETLAKLVPMLI
jgi:hypothetical protein